MEEKQFILKHKSSVDTRRLGKELKLSPKLKVELSEGGISIETVGNTVSITLDIDNEPIFICMSESAWQKHNSGFEVNYQTIQNHIKEIKKKNGKRRN
jgi:hypothetical protein